ncbi:MAG: YitT family protein [Treponema sp.]|nr:YitT family protein [Treponema sp.]
MAANINSFVTAANLFPGGFAGVTLLIQNISSDYFNVHLPYSLVLYAFNIFPVIIGFKFIGKRFTIFSIVMIFVSGLLADLLPKWQLTDDMLLCSVFGGILNAIAVSCCLFGESSSGGTDFIAIFISERTGKSAWNYVFVFNCLVLVVAGILFGWDKALYSIIFQFTSTQTINFIYKKYAKTTLLIVTDHPEEIYQVIRDQTNHTSTVFEGVGEYSKKTHQLVYTVVSSAESGKLERKIRSVDPNAFINVLQSKEILGRFFKRAND